MSFESVRPFRFGVFLCCDALLLFQTDDPCYPNPCSGNEKCAKTNRESYYCQEIIPKDCGDILVTGKGSGVYAINIDGTHGFKVYCDMETNGGGYTVFQNRYDGSVDFYNARTWANFKHGFGNLSGEFWLGLENIHQMTRKNEFMLRVDLEDHYGVKAYAEYTTFSVNSEADKYRLGIAGYSGTAGDFKDSGMLNDANMQFSTPDMNTFCTLRMKSGWWHEYCTHSNLNGVYNAGIFWYGFKQYTDLKKVSMKIKRK
ncbi:fibroleukin-like [Mytilus trossulus]|uniref:fibroleukin-like n=1 Tax=Mytilus trossulus TaxID=6551 RepID=UPI003005F624